MNLYFAIVIYNKNCENSITLKQLLGFKLNNIIIVDNSTIKNDNENFCKKNNIFYINMNGNKGLSKAYNVVVKYLKDSLGYIMWLDDDTFITKEYVETVLDMIKENRYSLIIPIIKCQGKVISPLKKIGIKYIGISNENYKNIRNIYAINSCLTVNMDIYKHLEYNEKLFLDNIDLDFFEKIHKIKNIKIKIINSSIEQKLFLLENTDVEQFKKRYIIYLKDNIVFYNTNLYRKVMLILKVMYCSIKYTIKYKKIYLFSYIIKNFLKMAKEERK